MVTVLLELSYRNNYDECTISVYKSLIIFLAKHFLLCWEELVSKLFYIQSFEVTCMRYIDNNINITHS